MRAESGETFRSNAATQRSIREAQGSEPDNKDAERKPSLNASVSLNAADQAANEDFDMLEDRRRLRMQRDADRITRVGRGGDDAGIVVVAIAFCSWRDAMIKRYALGALCIYICIERERYMAREYAL